MANAPVLDYAPSTLAEAARLQTVQALPDAKRDGGTLPMYFMTQRGIILPAWGTGERERALRSFYRHDRNNIVQGAISGLAKKIAATPWEIKGENDAEVKYYQTIFRNAQFGAGWSEFIKMWVLDYLRQDRGVYIEITAPGDPRYAPTGSITGLSILDSVHCYPTGDPRYPVIYRSRLGTSHLLPATRVLHSVDMRDTDEDRPGYGLCALSRAIAVVQRQILMGQYISAKLDDMPPAGVNIWTNVDSIELQTAVTLAQSQQSADAGSVWGRSINIHGIAMDRPVDMKPISFSQAPDKFDYPVYVDVDVKELALAMNFDIQEIWPLTGGPIGTAGQSQIQHDKGQGKAPADIYTTLERRLNDVLPEGLEFAFKPKDIRSDEADAKNASSWVTTVGSAPLTDDEKRRVLADKVEAFQNVLLDPQGQVIRLDDADPKPLAIGNDTAVALGSAAPLAIGTDTAPAQALQLGAPQAALMLGSGKKDYESTRDEFVNNVADLVGAGNNDEMSRRRFGIVFRAQLRRLGQKAFADGMAQGGVTDPLDDDELAQVQMWLAEQSGYVTQFANDVFGRGYSRDEIRHHAEMWANKSLREVFDMGRMAADRNGMYEWWLGNTEEHCVDCPRLAGQVHRFKRWYQTGWLPGASRLGCRGFRCDCSLQRSNKPAAGRF